MSRSLPTAPFLAMDHAFGASRFFVPLIVYCAFAAFVYWMHGPEPALNIDHISYMKLANEMRADFPGGDYWRSFNSVRAYGVVLAYAYELTGSHLVSFKLLLALVTVAYLFSFQLLMRLATRSRTEAVLFSLLSALFVSFGASMWGMTDFSASLNRSVIIPIIVVLTWFYFRNFDSPWRSAIYPALTLISLLHLSALHVFLVFCVFEALDWVLRRRFRIDRYLGWLAVSLAVSLAVLAALERTGASPTGYIGELLSMAVPPPAKTIAPSAAPSVAPLPGAPGSPKPPPAEPTVVDGKLTPKAAWRIELLAFPWRNFPLPLATVATMLSSFGVIMLLAIAGAARCFRSGAARPLDRQMALFALATPAAAFGLQATLWATRGWLAVLPINFEEVRAINMIMIPAVYFVFRLWQLAPVASGLPRGAIHAAVIVAFALQPIVVLRAMPAAWREALIVRAVDVGVIKRNDSPRMLYARQYLGLEGGRRFYYSTRALVAWLQRHAGPDDKVLSNLNELHLSGIKSVGPFLTVLSFQVWEPNRAKWAQSLESVDRALASRDLDRVRELARSLGATYAVVDWPVEDAVYRDAYFSVIRVQQRPNPQGRQ